MIYLTRFAEMTTHGLLRQGEDPQMYEIVKKDTRY